MRKMSLDIRWITGEVYMLALMGLLQLSSWISPQILMGGGNLKVLFLVLYVLGITFVVPRVAMACAKVGFAVSVTEQNTRTINNCNSNSR